MSLFFDKQAPAREVSEAFAVDGPLGGMSSRSRVTHVLQREEELSRVPSWTLLPESRGRLAQGAPRPGGRPAEAGVGCPRRPGRRGGDTGPGCTAEPLALTPRLPCPGLPATQDSELPAEALSTGIWSPLAARVPAAGSAPGAAPGRAFARDLRSRAGGLLPLGDVSLRGSWRLPDL